MLPGVSIPASLWTLLSAFRSCFRAPTFATFAALVVGFIAQTGQRTVCGMLVGAGLERVWTHDRAHRFFASARWCADEVGLTLAALIVAVVLPPDAPLVVAVDDTLFRRSGAKVHAAYWHHDASAKKGRAFARGNCWVVVGLVVELGCVSRPVCLPVLLRLWTPKGTTKIVYARQLVTLLAQRFPDRVVHVVADAAYSSKDLRGLPARISWTTRPRRNAVFHDLAPAPTGKRGRPRQRGDRLGGLDELAATGVWTDVVVSRYGRTETISICQRRCLWWTVFYTRPVRVILVREPDRHATSGYDLALVTTDLDTSVEGIVARYASRWSIEVVFFDAKHVFGVGHARNRVELAVARTVPFGFVAQALVVIWYAQTAHTHDVVSQRRQHAPWYDTKTEASTADMLTWCRRVIIAEKYRPQHPNQPTPDEIAAVQHAWAQAAA